jgi:DNA-binding FadR family transcriptional regulator
LGQTLREEIVFQHGEGNGRGPLTTRPIAERVARIHASILEDIAARDPGLARQRMGEHLAAVSRDAASA